MKYTYNQYKQLIAIILSFILVVTSMPPVRAERFLAPPGGRDVPNQLFERFSSGKPRKSISDESVSPHVRERWAIVLEILNDEAKKRKPVQLTPTKLAQRAKKAGVKNANSGLMSNDIRDCIEISEHPIIDRSARVRRKRSLERRDAVWKLIGTLQGTMTRPEILENVHEKINPEITLNELTQFLISIKKPPHPHLKIITQFEKDALLRKKTKRFFANPANHLRYMHGYRNGKPGQPPPITKENARMPLEMAVERGVGNATLYKELELLEKVGLVEGDKYKPRYIPGWVAHLLPEELEEIIALENRALEKPVLSNYKIKKIKKIFAEKSRSYAHKKSHRHGTRSRRSFIHVLLLMGITILPAILGITYHYRVEISGIGTKLLQWFNIGSAPLIDGIRIASGLFILYLMLAVPGYYGENVSISRPVKFLKSKLMRVVIDEWNEVLSKWGRLIWNIGKGIWNDKKKLKKVIIWSSMLSVLIITVTQFGGPIKYGVTEYSNLTKTHPWLTGLPSSILLMGLLTEYISQRILKEETEQTPRSLSYWRLFYKSIMFVPLGVFIIVYFKTLEIMVPSVGAWRLLRVEIDQLFVSAFMFAPMYRGMRNFFEYLYKPLCRLFFKKQPEQKETLEYKEPFKKQAYIMVLRAFPIWVPAHIVNFYFLPEHARVIFVNIVAVIFFTIIALIEKTDENISPDKPQVSDDKGNLKNSPDSSVPGSLPFGGSGTRLSITEPDGNIHSSL